MIPSIEDPRWRALVTSTEDPPLQSLSTKMMLMRVKMIVRSDKAGVRLQEAIRTAYEFFKKNEAIVKEDIKTLFG